MAPDGPSGQGQLGRFVAGGGVKAWGFLSFYVLVPWQYHFVNT